MTVLRGINFSDPVISPQDNRDVKNRWAAEALFSASREHAANGLSFFFPPMSAYVDRETKAITNCIRIYYATDESKIEKSASFNLSLIPTFCSRFSFVYSSVRFSARYDSDVTCTSLRGKATISGSLVGRNAGNDWILDSGGGNWMKCIKSGQTWQPEMKRSLHYLWLPPVLLCLLLTGPRELTVRVWPLYCQTVLENGISIRPHIRPAFSFFRSRKIVLWFTFIPQRKSVMNFLFLRD